MGNRIKKRFAWEKKEKERKKLAQGTRVMKCLTAWAKRGKTSFGRICTSPIPHSSFLIESNTSLSKFFPFFPMPQGISSNLSYVSIFSYFFPFFPSEAFFYSISYCVTNSSAPRSNIFSAQGGNLLF